MLANIKKYTFSKINLATISQEPGVYIFWSEKFPLYVGKSVNLKLRIKSYQMGKLLPKTAKMIKQSKYFSYIVVFSEIEALLLEAKLVNKLKPPYNIQLKDDKHPLYIRITKDKYPLVTTARKINENNPNTAFYGPFPASSNVKKTLILLRKIFTFAQHLPGKRSCIYSQMGLCNPCPSDIENETDVKFKKEKRAKYLRNIKYIKNFLDGNLAKVKTSLNNEMQKYVETEFFENAAEIRSQIQAIDYITAVKNPTSSFLENPNFTESLKEEEIKDLGQLLMPFINLKKLERIECYDVAHLAGTFPTASMITFINGSAEKTLYRHFKIRKNKSNDDYSSLTEVAKRRKNHIPDWGKPDLIIVDGGKGQVKVFSEVFKNTGIPIIGLAKKTETLVIPVINHNEYKFILIRLKPSPGFNLVTRLRNEAHRFARRLHHRILKNELFQ